MDHKSEEVSHTEDSSKPKNKIVLIPEEFKKINDRLDEVERQSAVTHAAASAIVLEGDKTMKEYGTEIAQRTVDEVFKQIDKNKDGKIQPKEFISWGGEMLNGEGFKMLLITLLSITFDYIYSYLIQLLNIAEGGILSIIGKLIAFTILTYGYKTVLSKVDKSKGDMAVLIKARDEEIEIHKQDKQANRLAIELLKHDNEALHKVNEKIEKENEELKKELYSK